MRPEDGYISYIVNSKSGASSSKLVPQQFYGWLCERGYETRAVYTKSLEHARELSASAAGDGACACVVAVGGDGTIREVAQGLHSSGKPLLMIPGGTENLLASELGFDERLETFVDAFEKWYIRDLDLGEANGSCFTSIAGIGFDGDIVKLVSGNRNGHIHHLDYFWPIWRTFFNAKFPVMRIEADGEQIFEGPCMAFVGNISRYAIGLQILANANYGDGLLDVCIYRCASKPRLVKHSIATVLKAHSRRSDVVYRQARHIRVTAEGHVNTEIDGDPGPKLPLEISVMPHAVKVIVPEGAKPAGIRTRLRRMLG